MESVPSSKLAVLAIPLLLVVGLLSLGYYRTHHVTGERELTAALARVRGDHLPLELIDPAEGPPGRQSASLAMLRFIDGRGRWNPLRRQLIDSIQGQSNPSKWVLLANVMQEEGPSMAGIESSLAQGDPLFGAEVSNHSLDEVDSGISAVPFLFLDRSAIEIHNRNRSAADKDLTTAAHLITAFLRCQRITAAMVAPNQMAWLSYRYQFYASTFGNDARTIALGKKLVAYCRTIPSAKDILALNFLTGIAAARLFSHGGLGVNQVGLGPDYGDAISFLSSPSGANALMTSILSQYADSEEILTKNGERAGLRALKDMVIATPEPKMLGVVVGLALNDPRLIAADVLAIDSWKNILTTYVEALAHPGQLKKLKPMPDPYTNANLQAKPLGKGFIVVGLGPDLMNHLDHLCAPTQVGPKTSGCQFGLQYPSLAN